MKNNLLARDIIDVPVTGYEGPNQTLIVTELVTFQNFNAKRIVGFHDYPVNLPDERKWIIVLPGFGETKTDVLAEAYSLAKNGFHTLRFDYSFHTGESDGEIAYTTLESMKDDIICGVDFLYREFGPDEVGALGSSLASRALLRAAREDNRIRLLLNLVSVVDLQKTLFAIYQQDFVEQIKRGFSVGLMDVLGFQVNADLFLASAIEKHYSNLQSTIDDIKHIAAPAVFFAAEKDAWVELEDIRQVIYAIPGKRKDLRVLEGAMHELQENPSVARTALREIVCYAMVFMLKHTGLNDITQPHLREIGFRLQKEKKRNKILHSTTKEEERAFWKSYLANYNFVVNVPDYWDLMNLVYSLLGDVSSRERILDAGCGIGNFGAFLLVKTLYAAKNQPLFLVHGQSVHYIGVDFVHEAILQARKTQCNIENEFHQRSSLGGRIFIGSYFLSDLETCLPFKDGTFDKVCCNLVVSYVRFPPEVVREMVRVLKPGGKIVITSLKPFADLSQVYRNFIRSARKAEIQEGWKLLNNAGRIKAKEANGIYEFFSEDALRDFLGQAGVSDVETYRALGNQANVASGTKAVRQHD
jgi:SAM-dependent methyltransferase/esterase/lipase